MAEASATREDVSAVGVPEALIKDMFENGVIYGHKKSKTYPKMKQYIGVNRNEIELIRPEAVVRTLNRTAAFLRSFVKDGKVALVVATQPAAHEAVRRLAQEFGFPTVTERWIGGTLTNFKSIRERVKYFLDLKEKAEQGEFKKYTKKEQVGFSKEIAKLRQKFEGVEKMDRLPDALFVVDGTKHTTAVREARRIRMPIVGIVDNDDDPEAIAYPLVANDHAKASVDWVVDKLIQKIRAEGEELTSADSGAEDENGSESEDEGDGGGEAEERKETEVV